MKRISLLFLFCVTFAAVFAQPSAAENFQTANGPLLVQPIFHGCIAFRWNNKTILVDPYNGEKGLDGLFPDPDLILITDIHPDHLDMKALEAISISRATFIVPQAVADLLPPEMKERAIVLANGKSTTQSDISITAIPMYNLPEAADAMHTKGRGNGYTLNFGGKLIYISGDTEDIPEMKKLKNIDVAFVCMNLPYTMDITQAASAVLAFKPKVVYPYHYRGKDGLSDTEAFKKLVNAGDSKIDVRLRDWYRN